MLVGSSSKLLHVPFEHTQCPSRFKECDLEPAKFVGHALECKPALIIYSSLPTLGDHLLEKLHHLIYCWCVVSS